MGDLARPTQGARHLDDREQPFPAHEQPARIALEPSLALGLLGARGLVVGGELGQFSQDIAALLGDQPLQFFRFEFPLGQLVPPRYMLLGAATRCNGPGSIRQRSGRVAREDVPSGGR
jgi:hypothetical protein